MGYEINLLVGKSRLREDELQKDMDHPFEDGIGHPYKKDDKGNYITTGRKQSWFQIMAQVDLCRLGYQDDPLNSFINSWHERAIELKDREVTYFYGLGDGDKKITEDGYGTPIIAAPIKGCLEAMKQSHNPSDPYRRFEWALALLESMEKDPEALEVVFYGH